MAEIAIWMHPESSDYQSRLAVFQRELSLHTMLSYELINDTDNLNFEPDNYRLVFAHESDIHDAQMEMKLKSSRTAKVIIFSGAPDVYETASSYLITSFETVEAKLSTFLANYVDKGEMDIDILSVINQVVSQREIDNHAILSGSQFQEIISYLDSLDIGTVLFADDDIPQARLKADYKHLLLADSVSEAMELIKKNPHIALAIIDINFAHTSQSGYDICQALPSQTKSIMLTGYDGYHECLDAWMQGADFFISKYRFSLKHFQSIVELIQVENAPLLIGKSQAMQEVWKRISLYSTLTNEILISGENGTGKELVAKALFELGSKNKTLQKFEAHNCAAIVESLFESEMFGHLKGSFTGAIVDKQGFLELAQNGLLFLDEIGDMPYIQQAKLLRALQEKKFRPIGSKHDKDFTGKVVYATNKDLSEEISQGTFRKDLYYRMIGTVLKIPPLRERTEDIEMLAAFFVFRFLRDNKLCSSDYRFTITSAEMNKLKQYQFPGNIRELEKLINQACINAMLQGTKQLSIELPETAGLSANSPQPEPVFYSFEQLCELLNHKIINAKGLNKQIRTDLIDYLIQKGYNATEIAGLLGMTAQSYRNLRSKNNRE